MDSDHGWTRIDTDGLGSRMDSDHGWTRIDTDGLRSTRMDSDHGWTRSKHDRRTEPAPLPTLTPFAPYKSSATSTPLLPALFTYNRRHSYVHITIITTFTPPPPTEEHRGIVCLAVQPPGKGKRGREKGGMEKGKEEEEGGGVQPPAA
jgi:hypothetical protein